ncbi:MAG: glycosyltransferase family 4 protein [Bacteroidia bacterium]|nr:glycosyltransferase family 4 protein [Bacteroidia bacterium]
MKIHIVSETQHLFKGNGVHTAFLDHVELLKSNDDVETVVNNKGLGDVYHSHTYGPYYFLKGLAYRGKRVHTVHVIPDSIKGSIPMSKTMMPLVKWYFKKVYSYADVCLAISPMVEEAIRETGADTEIIRIQNPINLEKWQRTPQNRAKGRALLGLSPDSFVVLGVGQLQARKGVEDFMDVASAIPEAQFVWAGGRPLKVMTEGIARIAARMASAPDNLKFTGLLDLETMPLIYAAADVMLFPSYQENCPLAPIEAAAAGLPVVFRDIEEYRHLYEYAYLKASSTDDFIAMTRELMFDRNVYEDAVAHSRQLVVQFDKDKIREKLIGVYERLDNGVPSYLMSWLLEG